MATRNERRKRAKAANSARTERIANAAKAYERALIIKRNLASPPERVYDYGLSSFELVRRNAGPSYSAKREDAAMLRGKAYSAK